MHIHFSDVGEYIAELKESPPPSKTVRVTTAWRQTGLPFVLVSLVCAHVNVGGELVELEYPCGESWGKGFSVTEETQERRDNAQRRVEHVAKELGLEVRAGRFKP